MSLILFILSIGLIAFHLFIFPIILIVFSFFKPKPVFSLCKSDEASPFVTIVVTCHNEGRVIYEKALNLSKLDYPVNRLQLIFAVDGPDRTPRQWLEEFIQDSRFHFIQYPYKRGKNAVINDTLKNCQGRILIFTDVDAMLDSQAVRNLVRIFEDPTIGGGCGHHIIINDAEFSSTRNTGQSVYWKVDSTLKLAENRFGSITSSYGTIYAIRRSLFSLIPSSVTDDAYQAMGIIRQGKRFVFVADALAFITPPSKGPINEMIRRRRVVLRSLRGLWLSREIFNPSRFGFYSLRLFVFKVIRRMTPIFMITGFLTNWILFPTHSIWKAILFIQICFYLLAFIGFNDSIPQEKMHKSFRQICAVALYFCAGNIGTFLGLTDYIKGRQVDRW